MHRMTTYTIAVAVAVALGACTGSSRSYDSRADALENGADSQERSVVAIRALDRGRVLWTGSAVAVHRANGVTAFLTAAHNVVYEPGFTPPGATEWTVVPGTNLELRTAGRVWIGVPAGVDDVYVQSEYIDSQGEDVWDLAIVTARNLDVPPIAPLLLPAHIDAERAASVEFRVVGYGLEAPRTDPRGTAGRRREARMRIDEDWLWYYANTSESHPAQTLYLRQGDVGQPAVRSGDSGGAVLWDSCTGTLVAGILVRSAFAANQPLSESSMFTAARAVHVPFHSVWITSTLENM